MICAICNANEVESTKPGTDFCRFCYYDGSAARRALQPLLDRIEALDEVVQTPGVWHTGGGCFNLAIFLADGRLLTPSEAYVDERDGSVWPEPGLPGWNGDESSRWGIVVSDSEEAWSEWDEARLWIPQETYANDDLPEAIAKIARGEIARPVKETV